MLVALVAIPLLIKGLGTDRFGVLTLAWMVIGYFSLFDLGLGRALTKLVAEKLGGGKEQELFSLVWTALALMGVLGFVGTTVAMGLSPLLVYRVLKIPEHLQNETLNAFYLLALSIPVVISTAGLRGILEAHQRFDLTNAVRIPMGVFTFAGPLLVLPFSQNLFVVIAVLVLGRVIAWAGHLTLCFLIMPTLRLGIARHRAAMRPLLSFGSWMTVTNIIGPLMVSLDRFLIGAMISITAVAYYATPYEIVTRLTIVPSALVGVLFPAFSASLVQDRSRTTMLFWRGVNYIFLALFPLTLLIVTWAHEGLNIWLGAEFAKNSAFVLQWLCIGVFINSLAQIPFALIQGAGRPDLTAKLHIIELPFYLLAVWWLISNYGIKGAAIVWVMRVAVDTAFLFGMAQRFLPNSTAGRRPVAFAIPAALLTLFLIPLLSGIAIKIIFLFLMMLSFTLVSWFLILAPEERVNVQNRLKIIRIFSETIKP